MVERHSGGCYCCKISDCCCRLKLISNCFQEEDFLSRAFNGCWFLLFIGCGLISIQWRPPKNHNPQNAIHDLRSTIEKVKSAIDNFLESFGWILIKYKTNHRLTICYLFLSFAKKTIRTSWNKSIKNMLQNTIK